MAYETRAGLPSEAETYSRFMDHLRQCQEDAAMLSHLTGLAGSRVATSRGWLVISEQIKQMQHVITQIAIGKLS